MIERTTRLPFAADTVYAWHTRPGALERLLPPWERVEVVEQAGGIEDGARTVLRVRLGPVWIRWVARHRDHGPGRGFTDEQIQGPFAHWIHTHRVAPDPGGGCLLTDRVEYAPPYGTMGAALDLWLVRRRVERLLAYRHAVLRDDLAAHARFAARGPLHVAITGGSGLIGRALVPFLTTGGHRLSRMVRRTPAAGEIGWDPAAGRIDAAALEGVDAVVHLAGENIAAGPWTAERKRRMRESRVEGTRVLAQALAGLRARPRVLVAASAVGIYGDRGDEVLTDTASPGPPGQFLADLTRDWEAAADPARAAGIRVAQPRLGAVLTPAGGALGKMLPVFRLGLGGPLGEGRQWMSWVSIDDAVGAVHHALFTDALAGGFNAVAPEPVTNATFTAVLGRVLRRPAKLRVPAILLETIFGELAEAALLASARALPGRLVESGYRFRQATLERALRHVLGRPANL
jgi:uncharacterized protein (TIGR01777 family)